jgi:hypothetical protein
MFRFNFLLVSLVCSLALGACGGVPLRSVPKLLQLSDELLTASPAEFMVALQVDERMVPPSGAVPVLTIKIEPTKPGAFEVIDKKLPLEVAVIAGTKLGLEPAGKGRQWLLYSMPANTQQELLRLQETIKRNQSEAKAKGGGSVSIGVKQDSLTTKDPALANTRWETWLQTKRQDGFFEVWSGTPAQLQKLAAK